MAENLLKIVGQPKMAIEISYEIHTLLGLSVSTTVVPTPILRVYETGDLHASAAKTNGIVSGGPAGAHDVSSFCLLFGCAYPDLPIAKALVLLRLKVTPPLISLLILAS